MSLVARLRASAARWPAAGGGSGGPRPALAVPVALGVVLLLLLAAGLLLRGRASSSALAANPDTGPVLVGAPLPPDGQAGPTTVSLSPSAAAHPRAEEVRALVQRSVDARNARDFRAWAATTTATGTDDAFRRETRSERIGTVVLRRVDPVGAGELVVPAAMVTTQDPADAPADLRAPRLCWQISLVVLPGSPARLVEPRPGSALRTPC